MDAAQGFDKLSPNGFLSAARPIPYIPADITNAYQNPNTTTR